MKSYAQSLREALGRKNFDKIVNNLNFYEQENGLITPAHMRKEGDVEEEEGAELEDKVVVDSMHANYLRAAADGIVSSKLLVDVDGTLLCAVTSKAGEGTSYHYGEGENGDPEAICSPMSCIDLAMYMSQIARNSTIITWGGLTADFRWMYGQGLAMDEWAYIASNHVDMLYQLRSTAGSKINLQLACQSMGIVAPEEGLKSFKIETAISDWKSGNARSRRSILSYMRGYCKLLLCLYGSVANAESFYVNPKSSKLIEQSKAEFPMKWEKVAEVYRNKWINDGMEKKSSNNEAYATVGVMHNWLVDHSIRIKKDIHQIGPPTNVLTDLLGSKH